VNRNVVDEPGPGADQGFAGVDQGKVRHVMGKATRGVLTGKISQPKEQSNSVAESRLRSAVQNLVTQVGEVRRRC
jgi:hypothetical protein